MKFYKYTVVFIKDKDDPDTYNVSVPAFPEIATFGSSLEEARYMAQDALELTILSRLEEGETIPRNNRPAKHPKTAIVEEMVVSVALQVEATPFENVKTAFFQS